MIIKIGMENEFYWVRHFFVFDVIHKFGFNPLVIRWIYACIRTLWIAPLVKKMLVPFFHIDDGLSQGCPLSPLPYIMMVESLCRKLELERLNDNLPGIKIVRGVKRINHFQFTNNTILI